MNRFRDADCHSELCRFFDRHHFGTIIDMSSESLSTSVRNGYRHRPESARTTGQATQASFHPLHLVRAPNGKELTQYRVAARRRDQLGIPQATGELP
jgi:hypothetical protein